MGKYTGLKQLAENKLSAAFFDRWEGMRYLIFNKSLNQNQKKKLNILLPNEIYDNFVISNDKDEEQILKNFFYEEGIRVLLASNITYLEKYLLTVLANMKDLTYTSYELALIQLLRKDFKVYKLLDDNFSKIPDYLSFDLVNLYYNGLNKSKTADESYMHRNTLNYRLKKAYNLTGYNFDDMLSLSLYYLYYIVQSEQDKIF